VRCAATLTKIRPFIVSNQHTRKTFFAKALAGLAGLGLLGGARLAAKSADDVSAGISSADASSVARLPVAVQVDTRSVARSSDSL
jgi:hypothetical protein